MKILMISHEYPPIGGGGANACMYLSREYAKAHHDVTIVSVWFEGQSETEDKNGVHIIRVKSKRRYKEHCSFLEMADYLCKAWPTVKSLEKEHHFDICQVFFGIPSGPIGYALRKKYRIPYVIRFGGGDIPGFQDRFAFLYKLIGPFLKVIWDHADALIANSEGLRKLALDFYDKNPVDIIYNGVDTENFYPFTKNRNNHDSDDERINLLFVSRLIERKGLQFVIPKLKEIEKKSHKKIRLLIVGDGPYKEELQRIAEMYDCMDKICFVGQKDKTELLPFYQQADIFILPSKKEGMPNVVLEAMACGLPIVMTPCEGSKELISNNGMISSIDTFSDKVTMLCANAALRQDMGRNSLANIEKDFQWKIVGKKYLDVLDTIVEKMI
mgnify:FL=1